MQTLSTVALTCVPGQTARRSSSRVTIGPAARRGGGARRTPSAAARRPSRHVGTAVRRRPGGARRRSDPSPPSSAEDELVARRGFVRQRIAGASRRTGFEPGPNPIRTSGAWTAATRRAYAAAHTDRMSVKEPTRSSQAASAGDELPRDRAFVLQLRGRASAGESFAGRIEHVASGQTTRFESFEEVVAFVNRWLPAPLAGLPRRSGRNDAAQKR